VLEVNSQADGKVTDTPCASGLRASEPTPSSRDPIVVIPIASSSSGDPDGIPCVAGSGRSAEMQTRQPNVMLRRLTAKGWLCYDHTFLAVFGNFLDQSLPFLQ
jgi:hypothetical protein